LNGPISTIFWPWPDIHSLFFFFFVIQSWSAAAVPLICIGLSADLSHCLWVGGLNLCLNEERIETAFYLFQLLFLREK